mgnify:CR=1 FL=1
MKITRNQIREMVKKQLDEVPEPEALRAQEIIKRHLENMFDEIGREDLPKRFSLDTLVNTIEQRYIDARKAARPSRFNPLTGRNTRR